MAQYSTCVVVLVTPCLWPIIGLDLIFGARKLKGAMPSYALSTAVDFVG